MKSFDWINLINYTFNKTVLERKKYADEDIAEYK